MMPFHYLYDPILDVITVFPVYFSLIDKKNQITINFRVDVTLR